MLADAVEFLECIARLPCERWVAWAEACPSSVSPAVVAALEGALCETSTAFEVWSVRDDVESLVFQLERTTPLAVRRHVRCVTERAALAMLARPLVAEADVAVLVGCHPERAPHRCHPAFAPY